MNYMELMRNLVKHCKKTPYYIEILGEMSWRAFLKKEVKQRNLLKILLRTGP